jgi:hypothetical protein
MALRTLSTADLQNELVRRERSAHKLIARRDKLVQELAEVEKELEFCGGSRQSSGPRRSGLVPGMITGRRRAKNSMSLPDAICSAMELRAVVSPKEAAELVQANGFKTTSKNFNMMVSNALAKDSRFNRVGRGQYERTS